MFSMSGRIRRSLQAARYAVTWHKIAVTEPLSCTAATADCPAVVSPVTDTRSVYTSLYSSQACRLHTSNNLILKSNTSTLPEQRSGCVFGRPAVQCLAQSPSSLTKEFAVLHCLVDKWQDTGLRCLW